jgi:hypothetical protein
MYVLIPGRQVRGSSFFAIVTSSIFSLQDFGLSGIRAGALYTRNQDIVAALCNIAPFYSIALYLQVFIACSLHL